MVLVSILFIKREFTPNLGQNGHPTLEGAFRSLAEALDPLLSSPLGEQPCPSSLGPMLTRPAQGRHVQGAPGPRPPHKTLVEDADEEFEFAS